jgi:CBS domain-containing protein
MTGLRAGPVLCRGRLLRPTDVMRPALTTVEPGDHAAAVAYAYAYLMKHAGATALVAVDNEQDKRSVGLITDAEIVWAAADGKDVNDVRISDLMTTHPTVISATTSVRVAAESMLAGHFQHLPVGGDVGLIGMVDIKDVCRALPGPPAG